MSGFTTDFGPSGAGHNRGTVPDPGPTAGTERYLNEDGIWTIPPTQPRVTPPPAPGPAQNQWACNIAGYLTYDVARFAVKFALDAVPTTWLGDVVGGIAAGIFTAVFGIEGAVAAALETAIFNWVSSHIVGLASAAITDLLDDTLWKKIHCIAYNAVLATPTNLASILTAIAGGISLLAGYNAAALSCLNYLFANLGLTDIFGIPLGALAANYDCSTCSVSGIGPTVPLQQKSFDLTVKDSLNSDAFVDTVDFDGGVITGTSPRITVVLNGTLASVNLEQYGQADSHVAAGVTISGLVVGNRYALQSTGGPWDPSFPSSFVAYSWQTSNDGGTTWDDVYADDTINPTSPTVTVPSYGLAVERTDDHHARLVFVATATSIAFRAAGVAPSIAHGDLGWQLLDVSFEPGGIGFANNGSLVRTRPVLNFVNGGGVTWSLTDDPTDDKMDVAASIGTTVSSVGVTAPLTTTGGSTPTLALTTPLAPQYGGTGVDASGFTTGEVLGFKSGAFAGAAPSSDGLVLISDSAAASGLAWSTPSVAAGFAIVADYLSADVTIVNINTYYDGPSVALTAGTWLLWGSVDCLDTVNAAFFTARLWDGITVVSEGEITNANGSWPGSIALTGSVVLTGSATYKISVANATDGSSRSKILQTANHNGTTGRASYLIALKIA